MIRLVLPGPLKKYSSWPNALPLALLKVARVAASTLSDKEARDAMMMMIHYATNQLDFDGGGER